MRTDRRRQRLALVGVTLAAAAGAAAKADDASDDVARAMVERAIEHHGGSLFDTSRTALTQSSRSGSFRIVVERRSGVYRYEVTGDSSSGGLRVVTITNDSVESRLDGALQVLDPEGAARARRFVDARVWFPFLPYGLLGESVHLHDRGVERWPSGLLHRVHVTFAPGSSSDADDEYAFWFDPETARLRQYAYSFDVGDGRVGLRFRPLSNYRRVGGLLFYDAENLGFEGGADTSVERIDPTFVRERLSPVSRVELTDLSVERLER